MEFSLDYREGRRVRLEVPAGQVILPAISAEPAEAGSSLTESISMPIGTAPLISLAESAKSIVFIVEDHTRHSPVLETLHLLRKLFESRGISWDKVSLLVATGTHRQMKPEELQEKFGVFSSDTRIVQHKAEETAKMKDFGEFLEVPIQVNEAIEADLTVGIGSIVPHRFSGWSGGAKIVLPGVASYESVFKSHRMAILKSKADVGVFENEFRELIDETGSRVGLDFIINFYYDINGSTAGTVAGNHVLALRKGVELARKKLLRQYRERTDVTVISSFPSVTDFWQCGKALYTSDLITKDGGDIVMVSSLDEGFGDHPLFASLLKLEANEILEKLDMITTEDPLAYVAAYAVRKVLQKKKVHIVSDTKFAEEFDELGLRVNSDIQSVVDRLICPGKSVSVLQNSLVLPEITTEEVYHETKRP
ncbi:hypothetical protein BG32_04155 [Mesotoga sp. HF07.pep.5.2.highcov]|uniref:lactate racemase domain-containing protein n=1 Tax=Mesotoga sp. HF07.pep.5.2.highcov TaxID=1462923 RepID=UPI000EF15AB3|nr:lactate racemase domain-containing protein [Mesotoga sp. HF07.pep.5.2.highcov]RLL91351.1 hypothetical protein BG32_04155 [Mesotoga sp. HF07.pep.5.2.highcov]